MATETLLESLLVRLVGDGTSFQKMLSVAQVSSQQVAKIVETATQKIQSLGTGLKTFSSAALGALGTFGVTSSLTASFEKYEALQKSQKRLNTAIEAGGHSAASVIPDYLSFATAIASVTLTSKGSVMGMLQQVESYGISGDAAKAVVKNSIAIAAAKGGEAEQYIRASIGLAQGNAQMVRYALRLRGVKSDTEVMQKAQMLLTSGWRIASEETQTAGGQITLLKRSLAGLSSEVGKLVSEAILPFVKLLKQAVDWFNTLDPSIRRVTVLVILAAGAVLSIGPALAALAPILTLLSVGITLVFSPWAILIRLVVAGLVYLVHQMGGLGSAWEFVKSTAASAWSTITTGLSTLLDKTGALDLAFKFLSGAITGALLFFRMLANIGSQVGNVLLEVWNFVGVSLTGVLEVVTSWFGELDISMENVAINAGLLTGVIVSAIATFKLLSIVVGITRSVLVFLHVQQIASIALWSIWQGALLTVRGAIALFNLQLAIWKTLTYGANLATAAWLATIILLKFPILLLQGIVAFLTLEFAILKGVMLAGGLGTLAWTTAVLIAKGATWLWNAALTVTNALLAPATLLAVAGTILIVGGAVGFIAAAAYGAYTAAKSLITVLYESTGTLAPVAIIGGLFGEWYGIIKDIVTALTVDMKLAWKLTKAGASVAVAEIKALWPPLWKFLLDGFTTIWHLVSVTFSAAFESVIAKIELKLSRIGKSTLFGLIGPTEEEYRKMSQEQADATEFAINSAISLATARLKKASEAFAKAAPGALAGDEVKSAKEELEKLQLELAELAKKQKDATKRPKPEKDSLEEWLRKLQGLGSGIGPAITKGLHDAKLNAVLVESAEALASVARYQEFLTVQSGRLTGIGGIGGIGTQPQPTLAPPSATPEGSAEALDKENKQTDILTQMLNLWKDYTKKPGVEVKPAGLGG